jgi:predicted RNA-binding Zn ribbon-like protein
MLDQDGPPAAPGEDISCALALVNTRHMRAGQPVDLLCDGTGASGWLAARALIPDGQQVSDADAARLRALRETVRGLLSARAERRAPAAGEVAALNAALASAPVIPALSWDAGGPHGGETRPGVTAVSAVTSLLAGDALRVLTDPGTAEPAPCLAHGCIRWFLRTHAARQWCSTRCGDRVRAARHYARHRPAPC